MAFECPTCNAPRLAIADSIDLGPGDDDDDRKIQRVRCAACGFVGGAEYLASRRGSGDSWHHFGYELDDAGKAALDHWLAAGEARRRIERFSEIAQAVGYFRMHRP
jgi:hypothetical protein